MQFLHCCILISLNSFKQLLQQLPSTCNPSKLDEDFPKFLDRAISRYPNGITLVIDNADNLQVIFYFLSISMKNRKTTLKASIISKQVFSVGPSTFNVITIVSCD